MLERYYIEKEKQEKLLSRKNVKSDFYNGIYDRYEYPVLTREHIPLTWRYDLNPQDQPLFHGAPGNQCGHEFRCD